MGQAISRRVAAASEGRADSGEGKPPAAPHGETGGAFLLPDLPEARPRGHLPATLLSVAAVLAVVVLRTVVVWNGTRTQLLVFASVGAILALLSARFFSQRARVLGDDADRVAGMVYLVVAMHFVLRVALSPLHLQADALGLVVRTSWIVTQAIAGALLLWSASRARQGRTGLGSRGTIFGGVACTLVAAAAAALFSADGVPNPWSAALTMLVLFSCTALLLSSPSRSAPGSARLGASFVVVAAAHGEFTWSQAPYDSHFMWGHVLYMLGLLVPVALAATESIALLEAQARLEEGSRQLLHRVENVLDTLPAMVFTLNGALCSRYANRSAADFFGLPCGPSEAVADTGWLDRIDSADRQRLAQLLAEVYENRSERATVVKAHHVVGTAHWLDVHIHPLATHSDVDDLVEIVALDVSARYQAERAQQESQERYRALHDSVPVALYRTTPSGEIIDANPALAEMLGFSDLDAVLAMNVAEGYPQAERRREWQRQIEAHGAVDSETQWRHRDGSLIWVREKSRVVRSENGRVAYYEGFVEDITARKRAQEEVRRTYQRIAILQTIDQAILNARSTDEIARAALSGIQELIPYSRASVVEFDLERGSAAIIASSGAANGTLAAGVSMPLEQFGGREEMRRGQVRVVADISALSSPSPLERRLLDLGVRCYVTVPLLARGRLTGSLNLGVPDPEALAGDHVEIARQVADSLAVALRDAQLYAEVQRLARTDDLTGLANRRGLFALGEREISRSRRFRRPLAAVMLDIDRFKRVNDAFGHATGDAVLRAVADQCRTCVRDIDILGRYGGEEFAVLLPETELVPGLRFAERMRRSVAETPVRTPRGDLSVTVSAGIVELSEDVDTLTALLDRADSAMYAAKRAGRNCCSTEVHS